MEDDSGGENKNSYYKVVTHPLKSLIKPDKLELLNKAVLDINTLTRDVYDFIHLHCLRLYENNLDFSSLDLSQNGIRKIADLLSTTLRSDQTYSTDIIDTYKVYMKLRKRDEVVRTRYDRLIMDMAAEISIAIDNNITLHFRKRLVSFFFNNIYNNGGGEHIEDHILSCNENNVPIDHKMIKEVKKKIYKEACDIVYVFLDKDDAIFEYKLTAYKKKIKDKKKSSEEVKKCIQTFKDEHENQKIKCENLIKKYNFDMKDLRTKLLPKFQKAHFYLDVKCNSQNYIKPMIFMNRWNEENSCREFKCFPNRNINDIKYVSFSTSGIERLFELTKLTTKKKNKKESGVIVTPTETPYVYWGEILNLTNKVFRQKFKKNWTINSIKTDGVGVSICFDCDPTVNHKRFAGGKRSKPKKEEQVYIDDYSPKELKSMTKNKNIVYVDPGKNNLIMCMSDIKEKEVFYKYTKGQRYNDLKTKYIKRSNKQVKKNILSDMMYADKELLQRYESLNHKTCNYDNFVEYLKCKYEYEIKVATNYHNKKEFRMNTLRKRTHKKKAMMKVVNTLKTTYGKDAIMVYGDWSGECNLKNNKPTIRDGLRKEIKKYFKVLMMDEFNTSKLYYRTGKEVEHLIRNMKNKKTGNDEKKSIHQILESTIQIKESGVLKEKKVSVGRDKNAVRNYRKIMLARMRGEERPIEYRQTTTSKVVHFVRGE